VPGKGREEGLVKKRLREREKNSRKTIEGQRSSRCPLPSSSAPSPRHVGSVNVQLYDDFVEVDGWMDGSILCDFLRHLSPKMEEP